MDITLSYFNYLYIFFTLIFTYMLYKLFKKFSQIILIAKAVNEFPMEEKHWFWGHVDRFPGRDENGFKYWQYLVDKYPRCYGYWFLNWLKPAVKVCHPDTVKCILKSSEPKATTKGTYKYAVDWIGNGMVLNSGDKWLRSRKLLSPVFHFDNLYKFLKVENKCVDVFMEKLSKYAESGESIDMMTNLSALTLDIILRCACSYENNIQEIGEQHPYMKAIHDLEELWMKRLFTPWQHLDILYRFSADYKKFKELVKYVHNISDELIDKRKEEQNISAENIEHENDILDVLLKARDEDGNGLSDEEIRAELNTILFAGHDTTAVSTSWAFYSLAQNPQILKRCQDEVDEMMMGKNGNNEILYKDLQEFSYVTCCIKESLRLNTTVPAVERELTKPMHIDGRICPAGLVVSPMFYHLHHNQTVWNNYAKFDPERFFPENFEKMDPYAFLPFSAGPRNCIGQHFAMNQMKIILAKILHKFSVSLDPQRVTRRKFGLVLKTEDGLFLKVHKR